MKLNTFKMLLIVGIVSCLTGCGANGLIPLTDTMVNQAGEVVVKTGKYTADASVAKEHEVHDTLRNRDILYSKMYPHSGFNIDFEMLEVRPGFFIQVMKKVEMREAPNFANPLPITPSVHPVWGTINKGLEVGETIAKWWIGGDVVKEVWKRSAPQYNGPYQPVTNSYNPVTQPVFSPVPVTAIN